GGEEVTPEQMAGVFVKALVAGTIVPIVFTDARHEVGVKELLDMIVQYAPSPTDVALPVLRHGDETTEVKPDPNGPFCGLVFRIGFDPRSNMKYASIRVFSGALDPATHLIIN